MKEPSAKERVDRLAETLRGAGHDEVAGVLMKDTAINMCVSSQDRRELSFEGKGNFEPLVSEELSTAPRRSWTGERPRLRLPPQ